MSEVLVMMDDAPFDHKPSDAQKALITWRLKRSNPVRMDADEFRRLVRRGHTWCGGCFAKDPSVTFGHSAFVGMQLVSVDVDNQRSKGVPLHCEDPRYLSPVAALDRLALEHGIVPLMLYRTFSSSDTCERFRIVIDLGRPITDRGHAEAVIRRVMGWFPECDESTPNLNRLWIGTRSQAWGNLAGWTRYLEGEVAA